MERLHALLASALAVVLLVLSAGGCDSNQEESDFNLLAGSWEVRAVRDADGAATYPLRFDEVVVVLFEREDTGVRRFLVRGELDGQQHAVEGNLELLTGNGLLFLPDSDAALGGEVELNYAIESSGRVTLTTTQIGGQDLVFFLTGVSLGTSPDVAIEIAR